MNILKRYLLILFQFSPRARTAMVVGLDLGLCVFAVLLAYSLRVGEWRILSQPIATLIFLASAMWLPIAFFQGVYRSLLRFSGAEAIKDLATSSVILSVLLAVFVVGFRIDDRIPRTLIVLVPLILFIFTAVSRLVLSALLRESLYSQSRKGNRHVLIYGAGVAGRELSMSINHDPEFQVVGFIDDNAVLRSRRIDGHPIWHRSDLETVLADNRVDEILLAIPGASRARRREIVDEIRRVAPSVGVRSLPNLSEIASGRVSTSDLREVQIEELLGRDQVTPDPQLMGANVSGRRVMVTGAGGSIGSELCRQVILQGPSQIILAERSELALYMIEGELRELVAARKLAVDILPRMVDVADARDVERVFRECRPETVFHAAAYKHVPLCEEDPIAGIRNNIVGTYNCCIAGERFGVRSFTLVSTDKAVRPSSVMGASKRVCEMVIQSRAAAQKWTTYSAVRFGNVLGSSGSVVPLFSRQIAAGGPVTITHRDATRYFMTVSEAAQLVVQAGSMAKGGEIFLLDMGEPVQIHELARMMIQLSGLAVVGEGGRVGDIDIVEIGLRPGEKVHEELLIDKCALPTSHERIVKASYNRIPVFFDARFAALLALIEDRDAAGALAEIEDMLAPERSLDAKVATPGRSAEKPKVRSGRTSKRMASATKPKRALES
jgi:FlaA1/EpsC-like NDP-sugar epimerase